MKKNNNIYTESESELSRFYKIFKKKNMVVIFPAFVLAILIFFVFILKEGTVEANAIINTKSFTKIISHNNSKNNFNLNQYNVYIEPINFLIKNEKKDYSIDIRDRDLIKISRLNELNIYSVNIKKTFKKSDDYKREFNEIIDDFIKKFKSLIFRRYYFSRMQDKIDIEEKIIKTSKNIDLLNKQIKLIGSFINSTDKKFVYVPSVSDVYIPPYQKVIGLKIKRGISEIKLSILKKEFLEVVEETNFIKSKKIKDFLSLLKIERFKSMEFYEDLKRYPEKFSLLKNEINSNIYYSENEIPLFGFVLLIFLILVFLAILAKLFIEWWKMKWANI